MEKEIWKDVVGYEGYYMVNQYGVVKSVERFVPQGKSIRYVKEKIKKININPHGYPYVTLCKNRKSKSIMLHVILAKAFIHNSENKPFIDHIDTNRENYSLDNLRWVTAKENSNNPLTLKHCRENTYTEEVSRMMLETRKKRGCTNAPRMVYQFKKSGEFVQSFESMQDAQRKTNINANSIRLACRGDRYSAGGFLWSNSLKEVSYNVPTHTNAKKVLQYDKDGKFIKEWESLASVCKVYGSTPSNLSKRIARGKFRGKYIWTFKEHKNVVPRI